MSSFWLSDNQECCSQTHENKKQESPVGLTKVIELKMSMLPQHSLQNKITQT